MGQEYAGGFNFHDPEFVQWWLESHYLLSAADQVAVAVAMRDRIGLPQVRVVFDQFIAELADLEEDDREVPSVAHPSDPGKAIPSLKGVEGAPIAAPMDVAMDSIKRTWHERRPLMLLFILVVAVFAVRGVMALWKLFDGLLA